MHKLKLNILLIVLFSINSYSQDHKKLTALFLGNSYTYVNNLPQVISDLALANGDTLVFDSNCPGGYTFQNHFSDATSVSKMNAQQWDYIILQAQSQEPSFDPTQVETETLPFAIKLDSIIKHHNSCTETVFYETWGRKLGDASNCASYPPICTYLGMQDRLRASYKLFADTTHATMSPAGEAYRKSIALNPSLELYNADQSHPSIEGSYLIACVFYEVLFHKSVLTNTYTSGVSATNVSFLQQIAHDVVNDSLSTWNIGTYFPWAPFTNTLINTLNYQYTSASPTMINTWYFGDGTTSSLFNPSHTYLSNQTYTVSHVVRTGCKKDSASIILNTLLSNVQENNLSTFISIYPIPVNTRLTINTRNQVVQYIIYNAFGNLVLSGKASDTIDVTALANGLYFIEVQLNGKTHTLKFIKQ